MAKVLISDSMSDKAAEIFAAAEGVECDVITGLKPEELAEIIGKYDGIAIRSSTKLTSDMLSKATNLKVIGRAGSGVDNVDVVEATKRGMIVMNTPGGNTITTAEHAVAMMVALARQIPQATASMREGKWEKKRFQGTELTGKTLGLLGAGNIGSVVASRAKGLAMNVIICDPYLSEEAAEMIGATTVSYDELLEKSDIISIHVPLLKDTKGMVNAEAFSKMKDGVMLVHCARGGIVVEADLAEALASGKVASAALDVFEEEPTPADNPLLKLDNVILTPHLGASTHEAQENVAIAIADQISDFLTTGTVRNALNVPSVPGELLSALAPYINLGEKLGSFQAQLLKEAIEEISIEYSGDVVEHDVAPITIACIKGLLDVVLDEPVNSVNAPSVAEGRGIKVTESKSSKSTDFASSITITVKTKGGEDVVEGALFGKSEPRIVRSNDFVLDAVPEGSLVVIHNEDTAGVIGKIGTLFAEKGFNVARLHLGRKSVGGEAVSVWSIDSEATDELTEALRGLDNVISVETVEL